MNVAAGQIVSFARLGLAPGWGFEARAALASGRSKTLPLALAVLAITLTSLCDAAVKNVVLVHGAFADGSGWKPVAEILERDGYRCMSCRTR